VKAPAKFETATSTYSVVRQIGEGGSGRVFEVLDDSGERLALKWLHPDRISADKLKRFSERTEVLLRTSSIPAFFEVLDSGL